MHQKLVVSSILCGAFCLLIEGNLNAQVSFTVTETPDNLTDADATPWLAQVSNPVLFETEAANILLADEVNRLPGPNENGLGRETGTLHFFRGDTELDWSFSITADATVPFPKIRRPASPTMTPKAGTSIERARCRLVM